MVRRKRITTYCLLYLLAASIVGLGLISVVSANPFGRVLPLPTESNQDKPSIAVSSTTNTTMLSNNNSVSITVAIPDSWYWICPYDYSEWKGTQFFIGTINEVKCTVDGKVVLDNKTAFGGFVDFHENPYEDPWDHVADIHSIPKTLYYYVPVGELLEGAHTIETTVSAYTVYDNYYYGGKFYEYYDMVSNSTDTLLVCSPPKITNLSVENKTYNTTAIPLSFEINETFPALGYGWIGYSIDNQANVTINGNCTLTGLTEGSHTIIAYANDTYGNIGKSNTTYFSIALPTATSTPASSVPEFPIWLSISVALLTLTTALATRKKRTP